MKILKILLTVTSIVLLLAFGQKAISEEALNVSIVSLISSPEKYNNKTVSTIGYASLEFENDGLFISESDAKNGIGLNSLYLVLSEEELKKYLKFDHTYVLVQGTFDAANKGHGSLKSGAIKGIQRFEKW